MNTINELLSRTEFRVMLMVMGGLIASTAVATYKAVRCHHSCKSQYKDRLNG